MFLSNPIVIIILTLVGVIILNLAIFRIAKRTNPKSNPWIALSKTMSGASQDRKQTDTDYDELHQRVEALKNIEKNDIEN